MNSRKGCVRIDDFGQILGTVCRCHLWAARKPRRTLTRTCFREELFDEYGCCFGHRCPEYECGCGRLPARGGGPGRRRSDADSEALQLEHELDDDALDEVRAALRCGRRRDRGGRRRRGDGPGELDLRPSGVVTDSLQLFLNQIGQHPLLNAAEEVALAKRIERGDAAAKEKMVNSNLRLVVSIAKRYQGHGLPLLDLIQDGDDRAEPRGREVRLPKGFKFSTYATWWIRQSCQRAVANQSDTIRIPVHVQERRLKLKRARQKLEATHGRPPTIESSWPRRS